MKNIGVVSLYYKNYNYGGLLQAYALVTVIEKEHYKAEQICIESDPKKGKTDASKFYKIPFRMLRKAYRAYIYRKTDKRRMAFEVFMNEINHSDRVYSCENIKEANKVYDGMICGSDQVWNPTYFTEREMEIYNLNFLDDDKRKISYAASVGVSDMTEVQRNSLNQAVRRFDAVSLREESAKKLFDKKLRDRLNVVLDPTLLLSADEWRKEQSTVMLPSKYIYCYFLGSSRKNRKIARTISKQLGMPIVISPYISIESEIADIGFGDIKVMDAGPKEFLYLIDHADIVLTDSFHACVFSLLFKRPFFAFSRNDKISTSQIHSRIYDFVEKFHLQNQLIIGEKVFAPEHMKIDWEPAYDVLEQERNKSMAFLKDALNGTNG